MTKLESITDIHHTLFQLRLLQDKSLGSRESVKEFQMTYEKLIDRFYAENEDVLSLTQYETAKRDMGFFMQVVEAVHLFYIGKDGKKTQKRVVMH
jgi:hypothetical protein